jgi:hypothetical protein
MQQILFKPCYYSKILSKVLVFPFILEIINITLFYLTIKILVILMQIVFNKREKIKIGVEAKKKRGMNLKGWGRNINFLLYCKISIKK